MYLLTLPENRLERKNRVAGWVNVHLDKQSRKELHELSAQLKDKGITCVYGSDLDIDAVNLVATDLKVSQCAFREYRRFNVGRNHGAKAGHVKMVLEKVIEQWKKNTEIPIRGGDSWISVDRRLLQGVAKLVAKPETTLLVTDATTATLIVHAKPEALVMNGTGLKPGRIYKVASPNT